MNYLAFYDDRLLYICRWIFSYGLHFKIFKKEHTTYAVILHDFTSGGSILNKSSINYTMQLVCFAIWFLSFVWDRVAEWQQIVQVRVIYLGYVVLWAARPAALGPHVAICRRASGRKSGARTSAMCSSSLQPPSPFFHYSTTFPLFCIYCMANFRYLCKLTHVIRHHISTFSLHIT